MADREVVYTNGGGGSGGMGFLLGVIILIVFLGLLFFYGLPYLNNAAQGPTINVPDQIDVNTNTGGGNGGTGGGTEGGQ